jgi:hypothetical protein
VFTHAKPGGQDGQPGSGCKSRAKPPERHCRKPGPCVVRRSTTIHLAGMLALIFVGCASIESFRASPRSVCVGDAVTVTWAASGDVVLSTDPALPNAGPKASSGSEQFTLSHTTRFTLHVHHGSSSKTAEADVVVTPEAKEFGGGATCSAAEHAILLSVPLDEPQVSSALTVSSVTNMNPREIILTKGNIQATVPVSSRSTAFARQPAAGTWTLHAPLAPNESCDDALRSVANRLTFQITFHCGE